jgi:hypothetical protein
MLYVGDEVAFDKYVRRTVKVTREHNEDCKRLLRLMGVPYVDAPTEAESRKILIFYSMKKKKSQFNLFRMCCTCQTRKSLWSWNRRYGCKQ